MNYGLENSLEKGEASIGILRVVKKKLLGSFKTLNLNLWLWSFKNYN
jgi:hypothetical protein